MTGNGIVEAGNGKKQHVTDRRKTEGHTKSVYCRSLYGVSI